MDVILDTILILAILIFVGYALKKAKIFEEDSLPTLNNLIVYIGLPCLIFTSIYSEDFSLIAKVGIMPILLVVPALITGLLSYIILKAVKCDSKKMWSLIVSIMITSSASMGFPICFGAYGNDGLIRAIFSDIGDLVVFLILSVGLIIKFGGDIKTSLKKALSFPVLWAVIIGILFNFFNIHIPHPAITAINYLGQTSIPLMMFTIGIAMKLSYLKDYVPELAFASVLRLLIFPLIAAGFCLLIPVTGLNYNVAVIEAGMPIGSLALVLGLAHDFDNPLICNCIVITNLLAFVTLPAIVSFL